MSLCKTQSSSSIRELAELTGIDEARILRARKRTTTTWSIDAPFSDDDDNSMSDMLFWWWFVRIRALILSQCQMIYVPFYRILWRTERLRSSQNASVSVVREKGLEEIGTEMGLTRERVRQIREKAIEEIRESGNARVLMKYLG